MTQHEALEVRLARMEEQQAFTNSGLRDLRIQLAEDMADVKRMLNDSQAAMRAALDAHVKQDGEVFVTKQEFYPVRNVVYGMVSLTLIAVLGAVLFVILGLKVHP